MVDDTEITSRTQSHLIEISAEIVEAYVSRNPIPPSELPALIGSVHAAMLALTRDGTEAAQKPVPPVQIRKTVTPDYIVSLEDGRRYQTLRRHLGSRGLTPEAYRLRWGLPPDYPMTAENYRARRSELARSLGLGRARAEQPGAERPAARPRGRRPEA